MTCGWFSLLCACLCKRHIHLAPLQFSIVSVFSVSICLLLFYLSYHWMFLSPRRTLGNTSRQRSLPLNDLLSLKRTASSFCFVFSSFLCSDWSVFRWRGSNLSLFNRYSAWFDEQIGKILHKSGLTWPLFVLALQLGGAPYYRSVFSFCFAHFHLGSWPPPGWREGVTTVPQLKWCERKFPFWYHAEEVEKTDERRERRQ